MNGAPAPLRLQVATEAALVDVRHRARAMAVALGFRLVDQTKIVTAVSELARNMVIYGGGGELCLRPETDGRRGLTITFDDHGPGIADVAQAMADGYTSGSGLGLGLGGARRLMHTFHIESRPGAGTHVSVTRWT